MRIESLEHRHVRIPFVSRFSHAGSDRSVSDAVIVWITTDAGVTGYGEIQPRPYVTGETVESVLAERIPLWRMSLEGATFETNEEVLAFLRRAYRDAGRNLASFAGIELALLDAAGQTFRYVVGDLLGPPRQAPLPPGVVIGFEVETAALMRHCTLLRFKRRTHVKVKVGRDDDLTRLRIIQRVFGDLALRLDANMSWDAGGAVEALRAFIEAGVRIESIEQPIPPGDPDGLRRVRREACVPVMLDESLVTYSDGEKAVSEQTADAFNIRVGKNGGLLASHRLVDLALSNSLSVHLGTMVGETGILSRAGAILGERTEAFPCLEGKDQNRWLLEWDVVGPQPTPPYGLGIQVTLP